MLGGAPEGTGPGSRSGLEAGSQGEGPVSSMGWCEEPGTL